MENTFKAIAFLKAKSGKNQLLKEALLALIEPTRNEEGCLEYVLYEDHESSGAFYMNEEFKNAEAFEAHIQTDHFQNFAKRTDELLSDPVNVVRISQVSN
ncbi:putative quinol monooxygenase [Flavobacterium sp. FlaQc-50]|jgi:quinol monooxygenase YgiN|uniref:putative quinol monooxygenase n=1 Tax=unclassified Flavobacterium TaxID=196869 RepID=UPI003756EAC8